MVLSKIFSLANVDVGSAEQKWLQSISSRVAAEKHLSPSASDGSDVAKDILIATAEYIVHIFNDVAFISNDWSSRTISIISILKQLTLDKSLFAKARANPSENVLLLVVVGGCFGEWAPFSTQTRRRAARTPHTFVSVSTAKTRLGGRDREKGINSDGGTVELSGERGRGKTEERDGLMDEGKRAVLIPYAPAEPSHEIRGCKFESSGWEEGCTNAD